MVRIAFLGLGAMGSRMAANLLKAGHPLTVWNRSPQAAEALVRAGARLAASPAEAAVEADFVIAMLRDDEASRAVWCDPESGAFSTMAAGAVAIESSTLSLAGVRALGEAAQLRGIALLDAPVSGSRPAAEAAKLVYLVGGEAAVLARAEAVLGAMGGAIRHVGPLGAGCMAKLATNALLGIQLTALAELIGWLQRSGVDAAQVLQALAATPVWSPVAQVLAGSMLQQDFRPQFPLELIEKDFAYLLAAVGTEEAAPTSAAARGVFQRGLGQGLGGQNMTAVASLFSPA